MMDFTLKTTDFVLKRWTFFVSGPPGENRFAGLTHPSLCWTHKIHHYKYKIQLNYTKSIISNTKFIIFNAKFIIFKLIASELSENSAENQRLCASLLLCSE